MALIFDTNAFFPSNDLWIGALARQHGMRLMTRDAHFRAVRGLQVLVW